MERVQKMVPGLENIIYKRSFDKFGVLFLECWRLKEYLMEVMYIEL